MNSKQSENLNKDQLSRLTRLQLRVLYRFEIREYEAWQVDKWIMDNFKRDGIEDLEPSQCKQILKIFPRIKVHWNERI